MHVEVDRHGQFRSVTARGHAGLGAPGADPVCAAVTVLIRTAARVLAEDDRLIVNGRADRSGELSFSVRRSGIRGHRKLQSVSEFLRRGLEDVKAEYPHSLDVDYR